MATFWFIMIAVLWAGFLVLEGFDFGVGVLHPFVGSDEATRRAALRTIGPVWNGNEVWLVVAGAGMFAAFPGWYATMFSGFYLALVLLLVALIARGAAIEFRGRREGRRWRRGWSVALVASGLVAPLLVGVALADLVHGLPIDAQQEYVGSFWDLLPAYSLLAGVAVVAMTLLHGALYLARSSEGAMLARAGRLARIFAVPAAALTIAFIIWTHVRAGGGFLLNPVELIAVLAALAAVVLVFQARHGWAFVATALMLAGSVFTIFVDLYPRVMVSSISPAGTSSYDLTVSTTSSSPYALGVMTVVLALLLPTVLTYQVWTYRVFRPRRPKSTVDTTAQEVRS